MLELKSGMQVRLASWEFPYDHEAVEFMTCRGYASDTNRDPEESHARAIRLGHNTCWTTYAGAVLVGDRATAERLAAQRKSKFDASVLLEPGSTVLIEGEQFVVTVARGNERAIINSNPIGFRRV